MTHNRRRACLVVHDNAIAPEYDIFESHIGGTGCSYNHHFGICLFLYGERANFIRVAKEIASIKTK
jgi:hypothetical protein